MQEFKVNIIGNSEVIDQKRLEELMFEQCIIFGWYKKPVEEGLAEQCDYFHTDIAFDDVARGFAAFLKAYPKILPLLLKYLAVPMEEWSEEVK